MGVATKPVIVSSLDFTDNIHGFTAWDVVGLSNSGVLYLWSGSNGLQGSASGGSFSIAAGGFDGKAAALPGGQFIVEWTDTSGTGGDATGSAIHGQVFNSNGSTVGSEFVVNSTTTGDQTQGEHRLVARWT